MAADDFWRPVLVGGTGRCGTTITGRLLNAHPSLVATDPRELRFISAPKGVAWFHAAIRRGEAPDPAEVTTTVRSVWRRKRASGVRAGLARRVPQEVLDESIAHFEATVAQDPTEACRRLIHGLVTPTMRIHVSCRWVDTTPSNVAVADAILRLIPEATIVHLIRDGRDVAASYARQEFGPDDVLEALDMWGTRLEVAADAESRAPAGRVVRVRLEQLVAGDRGEELRRLLAAIDADMSPQLWHWFDTHVSPDGMHLGRWRGDLDEDTARRLDAAYGAWLERLLPMYPELD